MTKEYYNTGRRKFQHLTKESKCQVKVGSPSEISHNAQN